MPSMLTCIANLSNDEVFTPPEFANRMLDTLTEAWATDDKGANLWADKTVKFLVSLAGPLGLNSPSLDCRIHRYSD